jgi:hypothetical protein
MTNSTFIVDLSRDSTSPLEALSVLAHVSDERCFHEDAGFRMPLGIYNVSLSRACDKVIRLCQRLEAYFKAEMKVGPQSANDEAMIELIDYIELALYAAAEHVDDVEAVANGFFRDKKSRQKSQVGDAAFRRLDAALRKHKRFIAAAANAIKHQQARIRIFSVEYQHSPHQGVLHGYYIEQVKNGEISASTELHSGQSILSVTTLPLEILTYLLKCSKDLATFLEAVALKFHGPTRRDTSLMSKAFIAAARLPFYTFGEPSPLSDTKILLTVPAQGNDALDSGLYGSILKPWMQASRPKFGRAAARFEGDGKSRRFNLPRLRQVSFHYWT